VTARFSAYNWYPGRWRQGIHQSLIGFGGVAFIVDQGEVLDLPNELLHPLADCSQGVRKLFDIDAVPLIDIRVKRYLIDSMQTARQRFTLFIRRS
jgi:hypothetical protein